jgi:hypothetical protein
MDEAELSEFRYVLRSILRSLIRILGFGSLQNIA